MVGNHQTSMDKNCCLGYQELIFFGQQSKIKESSLEEIRQEIIGKTGDQNWRVKPMTLSNPNGLFLKGS